MVGAADLSIWMNGLRVGTWSVTRGVHALEYDRTWVDSPAGRPLSLSLPFTLRNEPIRGAKVAHYFDNLLPDADSIRQRLRSRFSTGSTGAFDLLRAIGRDCVGAVQLLPGDEEPRGFDRPILGSLWLVRRKRRRCFSTGGAGGGRPALRLPPTS
jgi:serine/threonine-protein kinase HipA